MTASGSHIVTGSNPNAKKWNEKNSVSWTFLCIQKSIRITHDVTRKKKYIYMYTLILLITHISFRMKNISHISLTEWYSLQTIFLSSLFIIIRLRSSQKYNLEVLHVTNLGRSCQTRRKLGTGKLYFFVVRTRPRVLDSYIPRVFKDSSIHLREEEASTSPKAVILRVSTHGKLVYGMRQLRGQVYVCGFVCVLCVET